MPAFPARRAGASALTLTVVKAGATETSLLRSMTDGIWRIVLEFEPLLAGFLPLATLDIRRARGLSSKDRAELKVYLGRR